MKKLHLVVFFTAVLVLLNLNSKAQNIPPAEYQYIDTITQVSYLISVQKDKNTGDLRVYMKSSGQEQWFKYEITTIKANEVSIRNGQSITHLKMSDKKPNVLVLYSEDYSQYWEYYKIRDYQE